MDSSVASVRVVVESKPILVICCREQSGTSATITVTTTAMDESHIGPLTVYVAHSFADDQSYQAGLSSLFSSGALDGLSGEAKEDFLRRSRVFYFNQVHGCNISESDAKRVEERACAQSAREAPKEQDEAAILETPRTLTFVELQTLIEQGKTDEIPNNKHIPDAINEAPPSQSTAAPRKKPWELA
ncbi:hypothetical protein BC826DRAFT_1101896 [Russula brevipes]|nr:hypothetical protein BC826DRAFT_1101896 [Russula brevipes]